MDKNKLVNQIHVQHREKKTHQIELHVVIGQSSFFGCVQTTDKVIT